MVRVKNYRRRPPLETQTIEALTTTVFNNNWKYEGLLTTYNGKRINTAAVRYRVSGSSVKIRLFAGSDSYSSMMSQDCFSIGVVEDDALHLIAKAALYGHESYLNEFHKDDYAAVSVDGENYFYLEEAPLSLHCRVIEQKKGEKEDEWSKNTYVDLTADIKCFSPENMEGNTVGGGIRPLTLYPARILETLILLARTFDTEDMDSIKELASLAKRHFEEALKVGQGDVIALIKDFMEKLDENP